MDEDWLDTDNGDPVLMYSDPEAEYAEDTGYFLDDEAGWQYMQDYNEDPTPIYTRIAPNELVDKCIIPTLSQASGMLVPLLGLCFINRLTYLLFADEKDDDQVPPWLLHLLSIMTGVMAAHLFFRNTIIYLLVLAVVAYIVLRVACLRYTGQCGPLVAAASVLYCIICELFVVNATEWHSVRGALMIMVMKIISLGFDLDVKPQLDVPDPFAYTGYVFHPGSVIFGPWISFQEYDKLEFHANKPLNSNWVLRLLRCYFLSMLCIVLSTCIVPWLIMDHWGKWPTAYRDAQSFRFSHYFVCFTSELTLIMSGLGAAKVNGELRWDVAVVNPTIIEVPRSLVEVVTHWNLPMHFWLKTYVFKTARPMGAFLAVFFTYAASSILHGLNFQLAAVLLSLGFYSYIEFVLRKKLSRIFNTCIQAKRCKECNHMYKSSCWGTFVANLCFGLLAMFHLAYLGLMFDSSSQEEKGYTMVHTLKKWSSLGFASHFVALGTFVCYILI